MVWDFIYFNQIIMRNFLLFIPFLLMACDSVKEQKKPGDDISFGVIHAAMLLNKPASQKFIDKSLEAVLRVQEGDHASIDTRELRILLDSARKATRMQYELISNAKEHDQEIGLKRKALAYTQVFRSSLNNEFPHLIELIDSTKAPSPERMQDIMYNKLKEIKKAQIEYEEADAQYRSKYNVEFAEVFD